MFLILHKEKSMKVKHPMVTSQVFLGMMLLYIPLKTWCI
jgi:hypothetical protein